MSCGRACTYVQCTFSENEVVRVFVSKAKNPLQLTLWYYRDLIRILIFRVLRNNTIFPYPLYCFPKVLKIMFFPKIAGAKPPSHPCLRGPYQPAERLTTVMCLLYCFYFLYFSHVPYHANWCNWKYLNHYNHFEEQAPSSSANQLISVKHGCIRFTESVRKSNLLFIQKRCAIY